MDPLFYIRALVALVFVLSMIGGLAWVARRFGLMQQLRPGKQMQVVETCMIDPRTRLVMFRIGEVHRVALVGANSCQFLNEDIELADVPEEAKPGSKVVWPPSFSGGLHALS